jgi:hypothetical protein
MLMRKRRVGNAKRFAAVGGVAVADVECFELRQRVRARDAAAVGAAVERPIVEHGEVAVGGRMDVELDDVGAGSEGGLHGGNGVLEIRMLGRVNARGGAGVAGQALARVGLREAAMGEQRHRRLRRRPERCVQDQRQRQRGDEREQDEAGVCDQAAHAPPWDRRHLAGPFFLA